MITAALCWWNERPEDLDRCVRGIATAADQVLALDGAYARYPNATARSPKGQLDAIRKAAKDTGIGCEIVQPERVWAGQVQKRTHLLRLAAERGDWILTVDADHIISAEKEPLHAFLNERRGDVYTVQYVTPADPNRPLADTAVGDWHEEQVTQSVAIPHVWRSMPGMRVENLHWWYSGLKDGRRHWLWGGDGSYPEVPLRPIETPYVIEHRTMYRTPEQIKQSRAFLNDRIRIVEQTGQEDDQPFLPPPVFDYRRVPA